MIETEDWLKLWHIPGIGPKTFSYLLSKISSPSVILDTGYSELVEQGVPEKVANAITNHRSNSYLEDIRWLNSSPKHHIVLISQSSYPNLLRQIYLPPPILYASGNLALLNTPASIAIVGGRKASSLGKSLAYNFSSQLASSNISIVSGLARGIDKKVHQGALSSNLASTIAVLGNGLDTIYPREHRTLTADIESKGLLLSEFSIGYNLYLNIFLDETESSVAYATAL